MAIPSERCRQTRIKAANARQRRIIAGGGAKITVLLRPAAYQALCAEAERLGVGKTTVVEGLLLGIEKKLGIEKNS